MLLLNYICRHQFSPWNNFDEQTVYFNPRFDDISWYLSCMAKNQNLGITQMFVMLFIYIYLFKSLKSPK
jgi:hypothetical protein